MGSHHDPDGSLPVVAARSQRTRRSLISSPQAGQAYLLAGYPRRHRNLRLFLRTLPALHGTALGKRVGHIPQGCPTSLRWSRRTSGLDHQQLRSRRRAHGTNRSGTRHQRHVHHARDARHAGHAPHGRYGRHVHYAGGQSEAGQALGPSCLRALGSRCLRSYRQDGRHGSAPCARLPCPHLATRPGRRQMDSQIGRSKSPTRRRPDSRPRHRSRP